MNSLSAFVLYLRGPQYQQAQMDDQAATQQRIYTCLKAQHNNLTEYRDYLKTLTEMSTDADDKTKEGLKVWAEVTLEGLEKDRNMRWLKFWLARYNDDASDLDAPPKTWEDVPAALSSPKARFHRLNEVNDGLHRDNAALMAHVLALHGALALVLDLKEIELLPMTRNAGP
jgi:hypothetical protein